MDQCRKTMDIRCSWAWTVPISEATCDAGADAVLQQSVCDQEPSDISLRNSYARCGDIFLCASICNGRRAVESCCRIK